jgi:hypothetical protein
MHCQAHWQFLWVSMTDSAVAVAGFVTAILYFYQPMKKEI